MRLVKILFIGFLCFFAHISNGQKVKSEDYTFSELNMPEHYTLERCVDESDFIYEGTFLGHEVVRYKYDKEQTYLIAPMVISKVFKGNVPDTLVMIWKGGWSNEVDKDGIIVGSMPDLQPKNGYKGIFFANKDTTTLPTSDYPQFKRTSIKTYPKAQKNTPYNVMVSYGHLEKRIKYWPISAFVKVKRAIKQQFYDPIQEYTGQKYKEYAKIWPKSKKAPAVEGAAKNKQQNDF